MLLLDLFQTFLILFISGLIASILDSLLPRNRKKRLVILFFAVYIILLVVLISIGYNFAEPYSFAFTAFFWISVWQLGFYKIRVERFGKVFIVASLALILGISYLLSELKIIQPNSRVIQKVRKHSPYKLLIVEYTATDRRIELLKTRWNGLLEKYIGTIRIIDDKDSICRIQFFDNDNAKRIDYDKCADSLIIE